MPPPTPEPDAPDIPAAADLCADGAISVENILALVHTPVIGPKELTARGWFGQTDFTLWQRHEDAAGHLHNDHVLITVWKAWDFYLGVEPAHPSWRARLAAAVRHRPLQPAGPQLVLLYRDCSAGTPGPWQELAPGTPAQAWSACGQAWAGVLDYMRQALAQHRARYPLYHRLQAELTVARIEALTTLPVFTERYNDWWDDERNGWWEGDAWVGARQPCMHGGEPWGRALKLSWKNGTEAPGDAEDDAHAAYQLDVDEARAGPAVLQFSYAQRQSSPREPLPRCAAGHIARLLRLYGQVEAQLLPKQ